MVVAAGCRKFSCFSLGGDISRTDRRICGYGLVASRIRDFKTVFHLSFSLWRILTSLFQTIDRLLSSSSSRHWSMLASM